MSTGRADADEGDEFQAFLWSLLDESNRRRLLEFDDQSGTALDFPAKVSLSAAGYAINDLCAELENPQRGFATLLEDLQGSGTLPPPIPFFEGYAGAALAVASLSSFTGFPDAFHVETRKTVSRLLLQRPA